MRQLLQRPASQITSHPSHITTTKTNMQNTKQSYTYTLLDQPLHSVRWVRPCMLQNCSCKGDHLTVPRCMGADRGGCTIATDGTVNGHTCQLTQCRKRTLLLYCVYIIFYIHICTTCNSAHQSESSADLDRARFFTGPFAPFNRRGFLSESFVNLSRQSGTPGRRSSAGGHEAKFTLDRDRAWSIG